MASSGTEACWAGPGLGQGPRRRCWAWAEEEKDGGGRGARGWGEEGPLPSATSPEPLEDFCLAQRHQLPLEWDPRPDRHQDSESGESAGEDIEAEDMGSPESSNLPLNWFPQPDQLDMTEEEPDEALRSPQEIEEAGESCPRLGYKAGLCSKDNGSTSTMDLGQGQGQARDWVVSSNSTSRNKLSEHPEVSPSVDLQSTGSWSSGTMTFGHASDSLTSTWEGGTDGPQPTPLVETLPQSPSSHLLDPDDRTGGSVAPATPAEFHDSSAARPQSLLYPGDAWRDTTSLSCTQPRDQAWKWTRTSTKALPSRFTGSVSSLSPQPRPAQQDRPPRLPRQGATLASRSSDGSKYGRGQLNYPLPDFSKVGPRVRFPKDESYQPPKARSHGRQHQGPVRPLIFKSPAEIVREVLLSSGETCPEKDPPPAHPITRVPQEFQTPEQATELVHQLQEDYHKLLTKYAEAENTIDQLRLGAKVNLYSDPSQPSHSLHVGKVSQGTRVLSFTIPQPRKAEWQPGPARAPQASEAAGWHLARGDLSPSSPTGTPTPAQLPENQGLTSDQPSAEQTQALASQAGRFLTKVKCFEELMQAGWLTPQDQLKGFQQLKAGHAALEEQYLKACRKQQHLEQQLVGSQGMPGKFDPGRELEAEIFQLGIRLEELKDHVEQSQQESERIGSDSALDSPPATSSPCKPACLPPSSTQAPTPTDQMPHSEASNTGTAPCPLHNDMNQSSSSSEVEDRPWDLPAPLRCKELQMEQDFHGLLEQYLSVKSLPEAVRVEEEEEQGCTLEVDGLVPAPGKAEATMLPPLQLPGKTVERMVSVKLPGFQPSVDRDGHPPGLGKAEAAPPGPGMLPHPRTARSAPSHQGSLTSLAGSGVSERLPQKSFRQAGGPPTEEPWMASPETDSGFVGSETSRVSPLAQTPEHRLSRSSNPGTSGQPFTASVARDGAPHLPGRDPPVPRAAAEPGKPRSRARRHLHRPGSPAQQKAPAAEMAVPGSGFEGQKRISEQLLPSGAISPPLRLAPEATSLTDGPTETTSSFLLSRTERDQAIRKLQEEVSRLRLRLEDSLHQHPQGSPKRPTPTFIRPARERNQPMDSSAAWGSYYGSKSTERLSGEPGSTEQAFPAGRRRARSSSVPREVPRLSLNSESELTSHWLSSEKSRAAEDSPQAARDGMRGRRGSGRRDRVIFQGHYTGQEYHLLSPKTVPRGSGTVSCPHCQSARTQDTGGAATREPQRSSPPDVLRCPLCHRVGPRLEGDGPDSTTSGTEKAATRRNAPSNSSPKQRSRQPGSPPWLPPGLWYLAAAPPVPASPAFAYVSSVPIVPYPPASV